MITNLSIETNFEMFAFVASKESLLSAIKKTVITVLYFNYIGSRIVKSHYVL